MQSFRKSRRIFPALTLALFLSACGGGDGNNSPSSPGGQAGPSNGSPSGPSDPSSPGSPGSPGGQEPGNAPPDYSEQWLSVTDPTYQIVANTYLGYIADSEQAPVVLNLPSNQNIAVDTIVRVKGGAGGWKVAQNDGQQVRGGDLIKPGTVWWNAKASSDPQAWSSVAVSTDGKKVVAAVNGGQIHISNDGGKNWVARSTNPADETQTRQWVSVSSSGNGRVLVAAATGEPLYTSNDGGDTWTPGQPSDGNNSWRSVSSNPEGTQLLAVQAGVGMTYVSNDGKSWTKINSKHTDSNLDHDINQELGHIVSIADGQLVAAAVWGWIWSANRGDDGVWNWTFHGTAPGDFRGWDAIAASKDGKTLLASSSVATAGQWPFVPFLSTDGGASWKPVGVPGVKWPALAVSPDGGTLVAVGLDPGQAPGQIYISTDLGKTWQGSGLNKAWGAALAYSGSGDGSTLVAAGSGGNLNPFNTGSPGNILISTATTSPGTAGSISGTKDDAIELKYVGEGIFDLLVTDGAPTYQ